MVKTRGMFSRGSDKHPNKKVGNKKNSISKCTKVQSKKIETNGISRSIENMLKMCRPVSVLITRCNSFDKPALKVNGKILSWSICVFLIIISDSLFQNNCFVKYFHLEEQSKSLEIPPSILLPMEKPSEDSDSAKLKLRSSRAANNPCPVLKKRTFLAFSQEIIKICFMAVLMFTINAFFRTTTKSNDTDGDNPTTCDRSHL